MHTQPLANARGCFRAWIITIGIVSALSLGFVMGANDIANAFGASPKRTRSSFALSPTLARARLGKASAPNCCLLDRVRARSVHRLCVKEGTVWVFMMIADVAARSGFFLRHRDIGRSWRNHRQASVCHSGYF